MRVMNQTASKGFLATLATLAALGMTMLVSLFKLLLTHTKNYKFNQRVASSGRFCNGPTRVVHCGRESTKERP